MNIIFSFLMNAFRYDFPKQNELNYFIISDEVTQFNLTDNTKHSGSPVILTAMNMSIMRRSCLRLTT
jgi:Tfp pilus assembly ATPase PilU